MIRKVHAKGRNNLLLAVQGIFGHEEMSAQLYCRLQFSASSLDSLALISALAVLVEGKFASQSAGLGYCATVTASSGISTALQWRLPSLLRSEAAPNPCTTFSWRNFTVLGLCSSLRQMVLRGPNSFARIAKHVWICFSSHKGLASPFTSPTAPWHKENMKKKPKKPHTNLEINSVSRTDRIHVDANT